MRFKLAPIAMLLAAALTFGHALAQTSESTASTSKSRSEVKAAADALRADPDFGGTHKEKVWRFKPDPQEPTPVDLGWLARLMRWISGAGRVLVWLGGAALIAFVLVGIRHWIKARADAGPRKSAVLPSHVHELDIRPESLPDRIGAAASELWLRGEHRAALSLLYRGALSRLVHSYAVPIRSASTEGECVQLARGRLDANRSSLFSQLVAIWQLAIYGARLPESDRVLALCTEFDQQLGAMPLA